MNKSHHDPYCPHEAVVVNVAPITATIFTLSLRFTNENIANNFDCEPGQFNMLYLFGVGEIPISIIKDEHDPTLQHYSIRAVGRVSKGLQQLSVGTTLGVRGPYGHGWPLSALENKDIIILTGGLGCATSVSMIRYILSYRQQFGRLSILQGVKHSDDLIFRQQYQQWAQQKDVDVLLAADEIGSSWPWHKGRVTSLIDHIKIDGDNSVCLMCGPAMMMQAAMAPLMNCGMNEKAIYLNVERNMECAIGHCGHCQMGRHFVCQQGPVFQYATIKPLFGKKGF